MTNLTNAVRSAIKAYPNPFCILLLAVCFVPGLAVADDDSDSGYQEIRWFDLIPKDDLDALLEVPLDIENIADGSAEDSLDRIPDMSEGSRYWQARQSVKIIPEFNNKKIRIAGFVVPLESDEKQQITSFFLVPYYGACLHSPPPPPNQIIYAKYPAGFKHQILQIPVWVEGTVITEVNDMDLGTSAYTMQIDKVKDF